MYDAKFLFICNCRAFISWCFGIQRRRLFFIMSHCVTDYFATNQQAQQVVNCNNNDKEIQNSSCTCTSDTSYIQTFNKNENSNSNHITQNHISKRCTQRDGTEKPQRHTSMKTMTMKNYRHSTVGDWACQFCKVSMLVT